MAVSGFFGKNNLSDLEIHLRIPEEVYAEIPVPISVSVKNTGRYTPSFLIRVYLGETPILFPYIRPGTQEQRVKEFTFSHRGAHTIEDTRIASVYPFNFFIRHRAFPIKTEWTVFPHPVPCKPFPDTDLNQQHRGDHSRERPGYDGDILAIRDYLTGDSVRYINWKASARSGTLKTNELATAQTETSIIEFEKIPMTDLELKLSCLTFLIANHCRQGKAIGLRLGERFFPPAATKEHKCRLLRELAMYGQEAENHGR